MRTIWKTSVRLAGENTIEMPVGAKVIMVAKRDMVPTIWFEVETENPMEDRHFHVVGTGHPIPEQARHVGSWISTPFVWHLYEV